jgi:hypothetical protein
MPKFELGGKVWEQLPPAAGNSSYYSGGIKSPAPRKLKLPSSLHLASYSAQIPVRFGAYLRPPPTSLFDKQVTSSQVRDKQFASVVCQTLFSELKHHVKAAQITDQVRPSISIILMLAVHVFSKTEPCFELHALICRWHPLRYAQDERIAIRSQRAPPPQQLVDVSEPHPYYFFTADSTPSPSMAQNSPSQLPNGRRLWRED